MIIIRPHHLVCLLKFQGNGYSPQFNQTMQSVQDYLSAPEKILVRITLGKDLICSSCPYLRNSLCNKDKNSDRHVKKMDERVCNKLNIFNNEIISNHKLKKMLLTHFSDESDFKEICWDCSWYDFCKTLSLSKYKTKNLEMCNSC